MKQLFLFLTITIVIVVGGVYLFSAKTSEEDVLSSTPPPLSSSYEYFWGDGCQYCAQIQEFFDSWENMEKVKIEKMEVWYNKSNAKLLNQRAQYCGLPQKEFGVPFLFTPEGECLVNADNIINLFQNLTFEDDPSSEEGSSPTEEAERN